ncbi:MAG: hypothetical protein Kow002_16320 [Anaerolineales bacterium]
MQLDAILEVAIGLVFAWLVLSVSTSEIQEWIKRILNLRAKYLQKSILEMFKYEQALVDQFYSHPAILELCKIEKNGEVKKPEYIPNDVFAEVAMEILLNARQTATASISSDEVLPLSATDNPAGENVNPEIINLTDRLFPNVSTVETKGATPVNMDFNEMRVQLEEKVEEYKNNVARWFDNVMTQSSAWYKKNAQVWAFWIGLTLAILFNIDSINITNQLWREPTVRQVLVAQAEAYSPENPGAAAAVSVDSFNTLALPIGWTTIPAEDTSVCNQRITTDGRFTVRKGSECHVRVNVPSYYDTKGWLTKALGILISAFAAQQGAPFWFDILRKLISVRNQTSTKRGEPAG